MATPENDGSVCFLYGTVLGRGLLKIVQGLHLDRLAVWYLRSRLSKPYIARFAAKNGIALSREELSKFPTYRDFFLRERALVPVDGTPGHLISPCDGWLSVYPITEGSSFAIKGSHYRVEDLLEDPVLAKNYEGGECLVFRLCASDYHHYCYIDNGYQGENHYIPGILHSVQPVACEAYPVFTLNRRCWCLMATENFGPVVQTEIGALIVGKIANMEGSSRFCRGLEKGHFELAGSTIVLLFEPDRIRMLPELREQLQGGGEARVEQGMWIASRSEREQTS